MGGYHSSSLCSLSSSSRMMMLLDLLFLRLDLITLDSALREAKEGARLSVSLTESEWTPSLSSGLRINMSVFTLITRSLSHIIMVSHDKLEAGSREDGQGTTEIFKVCCLWLGQPPPGRHPPSVSKVPLTSLYSNPRLLLDQLLVSRSDLSLLH